MKNVYGVPITFLDHYCPEQFEIVGTTDRGGDAPVVKGKGVYKRILVKRK